MKKTRAVTALVGLVFVLLIFSSVAFAGAAGDVVVSLQIDNPVMQINGADAEIDAGRGTTPVVINGRTLVPIRAIIEAFGGVVGWDEGTKAVLLSLDDDKIELIINSNTAYLNGDSHTLDVSPAIINGRTMLPVRFVAEGFNLGVAWDESSKTVSVISNSFDDEDYIFLKSVLPEYSGNAYTVVNDNVPFFKEYELIKGSFEYYGNHDELGRCDVCFASIAPDLMPTGERESISSVTPTGWINVEYDNVGYLYNRCHLIGFQLTGENANERNLITGTRYLNVNGMLPFENLVADYIEETGNRVVYRSTPVFTGDNLVADGVLLEAFSVEDYGEGVAFCVFCYNVQPEITIDYLTGKSCAAEGAGAGFEGDEVTAVYRTPTGKRYHTDPECGGKNSFETELDEAKAAGLTPCEKCVGK